MQNYLARLPKNLFERASSLPPEIKISRNVLTDELTPPDSQTEKAEKNWTIWSGFFLLSRS